MSSDSEFIIDTGKTRTEPIDYSWRNQPGAGCLGTIDCKECGCIMAAQGSHCFCMGIYTCPRCGYESKSWFDKHKTDIKNYSEFIVDFAPTGVMIDQLKELPQKDKAIVSCILFALWLLGTFVGCAIGIYFFK